MTHVEVRQEPPSEPRIPAAEIDLSAGAAFGRRPLSEDQGVSASRHTAADNEQNLAAKAGEVEDAMVSREAELEDGFSWGAAFQEIVLWPLAVAAGFAWILGGAQAYSPAANAPVAAIQAHAAPQDLTAVAAAPLGRPAEPR